MHEHPTPPEAPLSDPAESARLLDWERELRDLADAIRNYRRSHGRNLLDLEVKP